jgi:large subunit ribosomal protein L21
MYAVVEIAGKQYKLSEGTVANVDCLNVTDKTVSFDRILMLVNGAEVKVGKPTVAGVKISAEILGEAKGDKLVVFKMKSKKGFRRKRGHRQHYTKIKVTKIEG